MLLLVRPLIILSATTLLLIGCTRERPTPEPTATTAVQAGAPATAAVAAEIVANTPVSGTSSEADLVSTSTPDPLTPQATAGTPTPGTPETFPYTVQPGDTLGSLAARFETDIETLQSLNSLAGDSLAVGQVINVPYREGMTAAGMPTPTPGPFLYTIQVGDTLSGLGVRFGVDPVAILEANSNSLLDPNNLAVGTTILIPGYQPPTGTTGTGEDGDTGATSAPGVVHTVQPGQGLLEIAAIYGVPIADILAANGLTEQDILRIGQPLTIPGVTARDVAAATGNIHIVQPGESLLSIAILYSVTVPELQEINDLPNPDSIFVGQELIIPGR